jgi:DNA polymerase-1
LVSADVALVARDILERLRPILESAEIELSNHDLKFDLILLHRAGIRVRGLGVDPMVASYLLEAGARSHDLAALADKYCQQTIKPVAELFGASADRSLNTVAEWATERADYAWRVSQTLADELRRSGLWDLYWALERPLIGVLAEMEVTGIRVDVAELQRQSADVSSRLNELIAEIHRDAGHEFNIDSPKQLAKVLFEELSLPVLKKLKTGPSTDQEVLEKLALVHPLPAKITQHRQLSKLKGTYLDALPTMVNPQTGKIHASFNQVVAATGRLSSSDPNLQNIPIRTEEGQRVRRAFVPSQLGWKFVCADYSQIELRMLAHFCGDPALCEAFAAGIDIHTAVACQVFNIAPTDVTAEQRRIAKAVNFGVLYGQSSFGLAEALHIDQAEAALFIDQYFAKYAGVDAYIAQTLAEVARTGFATTILNRRRAISGIRSERKQQLNLPERTAVNTVIQGSAADLIKQAMLRVHARLQTEKHPGQMLLQIHDELVFETPAAEVESLTSLVRDEMQSAMELRVPLVVDVSSGDHWQDA